MNETNTNQTSQPAKSSNTLKIVVALLVIVIAIQGFFLFSMHNKQQSSTNINLDKLATDNEKKQVVSILNCFIQAIAELEH